METILIELSVPACNSFFDFCIPLQRPIGDMIEEMKQALHATGNVVAFHPTQTALFHLNQKRILSPQNTMAQEYVRNGDQLMLV